jgi:hypothetical protein
LLSNVSFLLILLDSEFTKIQKKLLPIFLIVTALFSIIASYFAYPFYTKGGGELKYYFLPMPDLRVSFFYVMVFETAILSLLFAHVWMSYIDSFLVEFFGKVIPSISKTRIIAIYFQIIPIILTPIAILQIFGKTEFLESATFLLFALCYTKLINVIICPVIALIGKKIASAKFLGITSLWALISFIQVFVAVFNFVASNINAGSYAFIMSASSLFAMTLGIALSRFK